jgi:hypothetical protein
MKTLWKILIMVCVLGVAVAAVEAYCWTTTIHEASGIVRDVLEFSR